MSKKRVLLLGVVLAIAVLLSAVKPFAIAFSDVNPSLKEETTQANLANKPEPVVGTQVPPQVVTCIPNEGEKYELLGTVRDRETTYYLLAMYAYADEDPIERWDVLIQLDQAGCLLLHHLGSGLKPISVYMPLAIAQQLELQRYQYWIKKAGSKEKFQKLLNARGSDPGVPHYLSREQRWALQQLGIQVPKTYKLLDSEI